ncbi:ATP-binding cassette sub-family C member 4-like [Cylas formicarius]|uniref:ATP-binding cassette sub-family C member 4-like n=1 Tax=Cylas formicarius TaxID=197179 RepID=UPI002958CCDD|nr:ATP-binding cassette sub-family C member 4-like [Cylas formicarius]
MDHYGKVTRKQNPREKANFFSILTFAYNCGLFKKAIQRNLQENDIYEVIKPCSSKKNGDRFERKWREKWEKKNYSLIQLLWECFGLRYIMFGAIHLSVKLLLSIFEPLAIGKLVLYFNPGQTSLTFQDAVYYAALMIGIKFFAAFYYQNYRIYVQQLTIQIRTSFCSLIYRKALRLTPSAMSKISLGNIITLITKDVMVFENSIMMFNDMWIEIIRLSVVCYLIYNKMETSGLVGVGVMVIIVPAQIYVGKLITNLRFDLSRKTDERLQTTQETLSAIKIIKMYTWEQVFSKKVEEKRKKEMIYLLKSLYLWTINTVIAGFMSKVGFYALIMTYIGVNETANAEVIFYVLKCFRDVRTSVEILIPVGLGRGAELFAAGSRINKVLNSEELDDETAEEVVRAKSEFLRKAPTLRLEDVSVQVGDKYILREINTELKPGLTVIAGHLASGKSSLVKLFLKDYPIAEGKIVAEGNFSYCSQDPWLFPSSIKQNIVFGEPFDEDRYNEVVRVCALQYDLNLFEKGDETIVSDRGMNLSGGQQARINLARAVYKKSDVYLLDEPLHALDPKVQDYIFQNCILDFLRGESRVLVTHDLKHRNNADNFIVMQSGRIVFDGKPQEANSELLQEIERGEEADADDDQSGDVAELETSTLTKRKFSKRKIYAEASKEGSVDFGVYRRYFAFGGGFAIFAAIALLFVGAEVTESYSLRLLTDWINLQENITVLHGTAATNSTDVIDTQRENSKWILKVYTSMIVTTVLLDLAKHFSFINFCRIASVNLHNAMIEKLTTASMTFFDNYFIGNILNRFSQDLSVSDEHLPHSINMLLTELIATCAIVVLVASVNWQFIIPAILLGMSLFVLRQLYMPTARSLKRLEAATRSPLIGHLNASMEGVTTIRASKAQKILEEEFDRHQDLYTSAHYMTFCVRRAFGFFMDFLCVVFLVVVIGKLLFYDSGEASGDVGLAVTEAASLAHIIQIALLQWSDLENDMTAVERVLEYTEVPQDSYEGQKLTNWPSEGSIVYDNVSLAYKEDKVLKNISFYVKSKDKLGIVGRTGAGKSSIISTLFRLYKFDGTVIVDGVNTKTLSLQYFRRNLSIIPQDPLLFQGTIRQNIDPLNIYTDEEIWTALSKVYLKDVVDDLDLVVSDHGSNFSTGQRQLVCLARAIVKRNRIVILDEATSNMDPETEVLVQKVIEEQFSNFTVIVIAHRLQSVLDCHKVMVMEKGEIVEYDNPKKLLENKNSYFSRMLLVDRQRFKVE